MKKFSMKSAFQTKKSRNGSYSALLCVVVIAIAVAANLVVSELPSRYINIDLSSKGLYSISDESKTIAEGLNQDVKIYVMAAKDSADATLAELLTRYQDLSDHIQVEYVDPTLSPGFAEKYGVKTLSYGSLIVESDLRSTTVNYSDINVTDYSNYYTTGSYDTYFDGEGQITKALAYVTSNTLPVIYSITGHGEASLSTTASDEVSKQNMELKDVNLLSEGGVPEDADAILIYAPSSDYSADEADMVIKYLEGGSAAFIMTNYTTVDMTNFNRILDNYGVSLSEGIVMEGSNSHYYGDPITLLPDVEYDEITNEIKSSQKPVMLLNAQAIEQNDSVRSTVKLSKLLTTSDSAYEKIPVDGKVNSYEKEAGDREGSFTVAASITETVGENETQLVLVSSPWLLQDAVIKNFNVSNSDLFINSLGWMCEQESTISIPSKSTAETRVMVSASSVNLWSAVCIILIPIGLMGVGLTIWLWRRKK